MIEIKNKLYQPVSAYFRKDGKIVTFGPRASKQFNENEIDVSLLSIGSNVKVFKYTNL